MSVRDAAGSWLDELWAALSRGTWIDLTPVLENGMPRWPSHPPIVVHPTLRHEHDGYFSQTLFLPEHIGAHVDAPAHADPACADQTIEKLPVDVLIRQAKVVRVAGREWRPGEQLTAADIEHWEARTGQRVEAGDVLLVDFGWLARHWRNDAGWRWYAENQPGMSEDAAELVLERRVRAVGCDTVSCGAPLVDGRPAVACPEPQGCFFHARVLPAGILLVECLRNLELLPDACLFAALPLPIRGGSGSPVRAAALVPA